MQVAIDRGMDDTVDEILSLPNQEGQVFRTADAGLTGVRFGSSSTGDVNGDGNRDLLLTGEISGASASSTLYLGEGNGNFTSASAGLTGVSSSSSNIADLNEDGSADLLISGETANGAPLTRLYMGDGTGAFSVAEAGLTNVSISASAIADFDEDGHPDIFVTGLLAGGDKSAKLYLGDGTGGFSAAGAGIEGTSRGSASAADVDGDGHVDLLVTGENGNAWSATLYLGNGDGSFVRAEAGLTGVLESSSAIGDVDRDGHPDLLITGRTEDGSHAATLYLGEGAGEFTVAEADLNGVDTGSSAIRDVDGDGVPDIVITGRSAQDNKTASLYLGRGDATFSKAGAGLTGVLGSSATLADFDGDRDTDLLVTGHDEAFEPSARLYKRLGSGSSPVASAERSVESSGTVGFSGTGVSISFAGTAGSGTVTVEKFDEGPADVGGITTQNVSSYRYEIAAGGNLSFDDKTELRLDAGTLRGVSDPTAVTIYRRAEDGPSSFTALETTYDAGSDEVVASVGDFSTFALGSGSQPLPVELTRLSATFRRDEVLLKWQTASETNNAGFEVQRKSKTEGNWQNVGFVESKAPGGSTTQPRSYQYTDRDLPYAADSLTYRLKQVDTGGGARLTDEVTIERDVDEVQLLSTYPNPVRSQATVRYALPEKQEVSIRLYDVLGRRVRTVVRAEQGGRHERRLDVGSLPSGVYFLRLQADGQTRTQKLTVVR